MLIDLQVKRWFTQLVCSYRLCWISAVRANSWCSIFQVLYYLLSHMAYRTKATLRDPSVIEVMNFVTESQQCAVDKKLNSTIKASAAWELSKFLNSPEPQRYFTSWSLDNVSDVGELKSDRGKFKKKHQWNDFRRRSKIGRYRSLFSQNLALYWHRTCYGILNELSDRIKMSRTHLKRIV